MKKLQFLAASSVKEPEDRLFGIPGWLLGIPGWLLGIPRWIWKMGSLTRLLNNGCKILSHTNFKKNAVFSLFISLLCELKLGVKLGFTVILVLSSKQKTHGCSCLAHVSRLGNKPDHLNCFFKFEFW